MKKISLILTLAVTLYGSTFAMEPETGNKVLTLKELSINAIVKHIDSLPTEQELAFLKSKALPEELEAELTKHIYLKNFQHCLKPLPLPLENKKISSVGFHPTRNIIAYAQEEPNIILRLPFMYIDQGKASVPHFYNISTKEDHPLGINFPCPINPVQFNENGSLCLASSYLKTHAFDTSCVENPKELFSYDQTEGFYDSLPGLKGNYGSLSLGKNLIGYLYYGNGYCIDDIGNLLNQPTLSKFEQMKENLQKKYSSLKKYLTQSEEQKLLEKLFYKKTNSCITGNPIAVQMNNGSTLCGFLTDKQFLLQNINTGKIKFIHLNPTAFTFTPDDNFLIIASAENNIIFEEIIEDNNQPLGYLLRRNNNLTWENVHNNTPQKKPIITSLTCHPSYNLLLSAADDGTLAIMDLITQDKKLISITHLLNTKDDFFTSLKFDKTGTRLAAVSNRDQALIFPFFHAETHSLSELCDVIQGKKEHLTDTFAQENHEQELQKYAAEKSAQKIAMFKTGLKFLGTGIFLVTGYYLLKKFL